MVVSLAVYYFKSDDADVIVRLSPEQCDRFDLRKKQWVPDPDKFGILCEEITDYHEVSEAEAMRVIERVKQHAK
jgi:hypothetical protein